MGIGGIGAAGRQSTFPGASGRSCSFTRGAALFGNLFVQALNARVWEWYQQRQDYTRELDAREFNRKSLAMDYEYLEDTHVQELRTRALARSYFGIRGWMLVQFKTLFQSRRGCTGSCGMRRRSIIPSLFLLRLSPCIEMYSSVWYELKRRLQHRSVVRLL